MTLVIDCIILFVLKTYLDVRNICRNGDAYVIYLYEDKLYLDRNCYAYTALKTYRSRGTLLVTSSVLQQCTWLFVCMLVYNVCVCDSMLFVCFSLIS